MPPALPLSEEPLARGLSGLRAERPRDLYPAGTPIALRTVQNQVISAGRFGPSWSKRLILAKWVISGSAAMEIEGKRLVFGPGEVAIYLPTIPHRFWALDRTNEFCWISIDGSLAESFVMDLGLQPGVYRVAPPTRERIQAMADALGERSLAARQRASVYAIEEWYRLAEAIGSKPSPNLSAQVRTAIEQEFSDPELSAASLARRLRYHRGALSRAFRHQTGQTIIGYLTEVRLREARALLQFTPEPIRQVAKLCGFRNVTYFCRWFRKHAEETPSALRARSRSGVE